MTAIRILYLIIALIFAFVPQRAQAGAISYCGDTFAYDTAVNAYILEDGERGAAPDLQEVRKRLAWLVNLDTLFRDSYGSLGVHFLWQLPDGEPCTLDQVVEHTLRVLPPGRAAVFVDQRVYREGKEVLVQLYLRLVRIDKKGRAEPEAVTFRAGQELPVFSEFLPAQRVAFPPRLLTIADLDAIEAAFTRGSRLYAKPRLDSRSKELPLQADRPVPFLVIESQPDGWMRIDGTRFSSGLKGWLHADPEISARLRALLPDLDFLEGVVGYLTYAQLRDNRATVPNDLVGISTRANEVLQRFAERSRNEGIITTAEEDGPVVALIASLRAAMTVNDQPAATALLPSFIETVRRSVPDSRLRGLLGILRLSACCRSEMGEPGPLSLAARAAGLSGALGDFRDALAINPGNAQAIANLRAFYELLSREPGFPFAGTAPQSLPADIQAAYEAAVSRLPMGSAELSVRQAEIESLAPVTSIDQDPLP